MKRPTEHGSGLTLSLVASLAVAACSQAQERSYEVDATDESGGDLIVTEVDPDAVPVDLPEVEMTGSRSGLAASGLLRALHLHQLRRSHGPGPSASLASIMCSASVWWLPSGKVRRTLRSSRP